MVQRPRPDLRGGCAAMRIPTVTGFKRWDYPRSERPTGTRARLLVVQPAVSAAFDPTDSCTYLYGHLEERNTHRLSTSSLQRRLRLTLDDRVRPPHHPPDNPVVSV